MRTQRVVAAVGGVGLVALATWLALRHPENPVAPRAAASADKTIDERVALFFQGLDALQNPPRSPAAVYSLSCGLSNMGPEAVPALSRALNSPGGEERIRRYHQAVAAQALGRIGTAEAVQALLHSSAYRSDLAEAIALAGDDAKGPLREALADPSEEVRFLAIEAMAQTADSAFVEPLLKALDASDSGLRGKACWALGEIGDTGATDRLIAIAGAAEPGRAYERKTAVEALGRIGDRRAVQSLVAALRSSDADVAEAAAVALGEIGDRRAVEPLLAALGTQAENVRAAACRALGDIGDAQAVRPLVKVLDTDKATGALRAAARALGCIGDPSAADALAGQIEHGTWDLSDRMELAADLAGLGKPATERLLGLLGKGDPALRAAGAYGLCRQGDARGLAPLLAAATDGAASEMKCSAIAELVAKRPTEVAQALSPQNRDLSVRRRLAEALPWVRDCTGTGIPREVLGALRDAAFADSDADVRKAALRSLQDLRARGDR